MFTRIYMDDIDVAKIIIRECGVCLEGLEKELLTLEIRSEDIELLNRIYSRVRRIKRGSSFIGLSGITKLSRKIELILDAIRDRRVTVNQKLIDSLLLYADF